MLIPARPGSSIPGRLLATALTSAGVELAGRWPPLSPLSALYRVTGQATFLILLALVAMAWTGQALAFLVNRNREDGRQNRGVRRS